MPLKPKKGRRLRKTNKAMIRAFSDLGMSPSQIEKRTGHSHHTIQNYLKSAEAYADPEMDKKIAIIKEREILDLTVLNVKAKERLHDIAPRLNAIESIALMDRTFQQIRLLEGKSTQNVATLTKIIQEAHGASTPPPVSKKEFTEAGIAAP